MGNIFPTMLVLFGFLIALFAVGKMAATDVESADQIGGKMALKEGQSVSALLIAKENANYEFPCKAVCANGKAGEVTLFTPLPE